MSQYTDARSRPGKKPGETDDRGLFLIEFGGLVINTYDEIMDYGDLHWTKSIRGAKADTFPIIGRKRDAAEHEPGEQILGGTIQHDEIAIAVDKVIVDAAFIAEIDELLAHYEFRAAYAKQLGQSLASTNAKRIAISHILASRKYWVGAGTVGVPQGQPAPTYTYHADMKTDASKLEDAAYYAKQYLLENDMSGELPVFMLPHAQYLLAARNWGVDAPREVAGSGNVVTGMVGKVAGIGLKGTNHLPSTNITTGNAKYQGNFSTTVGHISTKMAVGTLEARGLKVVIKEQDDRIGTILIASMLNGHGPLRPECSIEVATAARA